MTHDTHIVGVDPGLVHTGVVRLVFRPGDRHILAEHEVVLGTNGSAVRDWAWRADQPPPRTFIEDYRPRSHFDSDDRMTKFIAELRMRMPSARVINNTGVKKVIRRSFMELLGVWQFATPTHHQDLRAAARIMLYGMVKDEELNLLLANIVRDHLSGDTWQVTT